MESYISLFRIYESKNKILIFGIDQTNKQFCTLVVYKDNLTSLKITENTKWISEVSIESYINIEFNDERFQFVSMAYALIGFVKFLHSYYFIFASKVQEAASFCCHKSYTIKQHRYLALSKDMAGNDVMESFYFKLFGSIDLSSDFYFSYTYDLTNTLQYNLEFPYFKLGNPRDKFIWNYYLLEECCKNVKSFWFVPIIHGYIGQTNIQLFESTYTITIIARKSRRYVGPRYFKRGISSDGFVANDVESDQIVSDATISNFSMTKISSHVNIRGSVPFNWSHETTIKKAMPTKPQIVVNAYDPYHRSAAIHFNNLFENYGSPIICLNLIKQNEATIREGILAKYFADCLEYLNIFLPPQFKINYFEFDMSAEKKKRNKMSAHEFLTKNIFPKLSIHYFIGKPNSPNKFDVQKQTGVIRVNCVDCLDRTNVAQYLIGVEVLGRQLHALGVITDTTIPSDSDLIRILKDLYRLHGDTLARQYAGSHMAHRIEAYLENRVIADQTRDIMQILSRYYQNAFQDYEKQLALNLFLGVYTPFNNKVKDISKIDNDFTLHNSLKSCYDLITKHSLTRWWNIDILRRLPTPYLLVCKRQQYNLVNRDYIKLRYFDQRYNPCIYTNILPNSCLSSIKIERINDISPSEIFPTSNLSIITRKIGRLGWFSSSDEVCKSKSVDDFDVDLNLYDDPSQSFHRNRSVAFLSKSSQCDIENNDDANLIRIYTCYLNNQLITSPKNARADFDTIHFYERYISNEYIFNRNNLSEYARLYS